MDGLTGNAKSKVEWLMTMENGTSSCQFCGEQLPTVNVALPGHKPRLILMPCTCKKAVEMARIEEQKAIKNERVEKSKAVWDRANIPKEFSGVKADFSYNDALDSGQSIYITGKNGRGKTHLACMIAKGFIWHHTDANELGIVACRKSLQFATAQDISSQIRSSWSRWDQTEEDVFARLTGVNLLIIDDFGKGSPGEWNGETFFRIIDSRWSNHKPIIITSQYTTSGIANRYTSVGDETVLAMLSRLRGWCKGITLDGPDRRLVNA